MDRVVQHRAHRDYYRAIFDRYLKEIESALPSHINPNRFIQVALITITKKPELFSCSKASVIGAVMTAASLGLMVDDDLGEAFLIRGYDEDSKRYVAQLLIGYQGFCTLAIRSGFVDYIQPRWVCEGDEFDFKYGIDEFLDHKPIAADRSNEKITHFYVIIKLRTGTKMFSVMSRKEVEEIRNNSPHYKSAVDKTKTVWHIWFNKMGNKTALKDQMKYIPLSPEMQIAQSIDDRLDYGIQDLESNVLELPGIDDELAKEVMEADDEKKKNARTEKSKAKNSQKVAEAMNGLNGLLQKKGLAVISVFILFLFSCKKDNPVPPVIVHKYCFECETKLEYPTGGGTANDIKYSYNTFCGITEANSRQIEKDGTKQVEYLNRIANQTVKCTKK